MGKLEYCYHAHTKRCGHAVGLDQEYIDAALNYGLKRFSFSDHIFLDGIDRPHNRGNISYLNEYIDSMNKLKDKYKDTLDFHFGFEAEYIKKYIPYYKDLLDNKKIDYLILGQHCTIKNDDLFFYSESKNKRVGAIKYTIDLIKGMKTRLFKYCCHPDFFTMYLGTKDILYKFLSRIIIRNAIKYDMALEINLCGRRKKELDENHIYANEEFFRLVSKYKKAKVIVGMDAHDPYNFKSNEEIDYAYYLINKYNLNEVKNIF